MGVEHRARCTCQSNRSQFAWATPRQLCADCDLLVILLFVVHLSLVAVAVTVCKVQHHLLDFCLSVGVPAKRFTTSRTLHCLFSGGGATRTNYIVLEPTSQLPRRWGWWVESLTWARSWHRNAIRTVGHRMQCLLHKWQPRAHI